MFAGFICFGRAGKSSVGGEKMKISLKLYFEFENRQDYMSYLSEMVSLSIPKFDGPPLSMSTTNDIMMGVHELRY